MSPFAPLDVSKWFSSECYFVKWQATMSSYEVVHLDHPDDHELVPVLARFEQGLGGGKLHETARSGLTGQDSLIYQEPFPKVESHEAYVYGVLATPTDVSDGRSEFFSVQFVVSETMAITVLWGPTETVRERANELYGKLRLTESDAVTPDAPGNVVVQVSRTIVADLQSLISGLHAAVQAELSEIESAIFNRQYQSMSEQAAQKYQRVSQLKFEILSIEAMIDETQNVFAAISSGRVAIRAPFVTQGKDIPPFSTEQRIWIEDLHMRARSLKAQRNGLEEEVRLLYERLESLEIRRQTAAQMRFAAVASILLLPALIVGFFGQNFNINPWTDGRWSWEISAVALAVLAGAQFAYFKIKRWF